MVALPNDILNQFTILKSLRQHEITPNSLLMFVVPGTLEVVPMFQREKLTLAVKDEVAVVFQLVL